MCMVVAVLFITGKKYKQPNFHQHECINKIYSHTMGYYSIIKKHEVLIQAATCINLENIMLMKEAGNRRPHTV